MYLLMCLHAGACPVGRVRVSVERVLETVCVNAHASPDRRLGISELVTTHRIHLFSLLVGPGSPAALHVLGLFSQPGGGIRWETASCHSPLGEVSPLQLWGRQGTYVVCREEVQSSPVFQAKSRAAADVPAWICAV